MIHQLADHISNDTLNKIVYKIQEQYRLYLREINRAEFARLFAEEYAPKNQQHTISWAISSAFPSDSVVGDLSVLCLKYGRGHTRPVLSNEYIELHILNSSTHFEAQYLKERYLYNSENFSHEKLFCYIKFEVKNRILQKVELCLPDENGSIIASEILLNTETLRLIA